MAREPTKARAAQRAKTIGSIVWPDLPRGEDESRKSRLQMKVVPSDPPNSPSTNRLARSRLGIRTECDAVRFAPHTGFSSSMDRCSTTHPLLRPLEARLSIRPFARPQRPSPCGADLSGVDTPDLYLRHPSGFFTRPVRSQAPLLASSALNRGKS